MTALPTLPGCGAPATVRIELWSPAETLHGSLDGSIYTCEGHAPATADAITDAGFAPHRMSGGAGSKRCGDGYDFLTGAPIVAPAPVEPTSTGCPLPADVRLTVALGAYRLGAVNACAVHVAGLENALEDAGYRVEPDRPNRGARCAHRPPNCCTCDPVECTVDDTGEHCAERGCPVCVHGCPAPLGQPCCRGGVA